MTPKAKALITVSLALSLALLGAYTTWRTHCGSTDFDTYYYAAKRVVEGSPLYTEVRGVSPYIYPPIFACVMAPLALMNMETASFIWYALNLAFAWGSLVLSFRLIFGPKPFAEATGAIPPLPKALFAAIASAALLDNISLLQANIAVFFLVMAALYLAREKRDLPAAFCLAMAISVKVLPILLLAYFMIKKRFKMSAAAVFLTAFFIFALPAFSMGPGAAREATSVWLDENLLRSTARGANFQVMGAQFNPNNQSVAALISRWFAHSDPNIAYWKNVAYRYNRFFADMPGLLSGAAVLMVSKVVSAVLVLAAFIVSFLGLKKRPGEADDYAYSATLLSCLLASPIVRIQYFIFAIFPAMLILRGSSRDGGARHGAVIWMGAFAAMYFLLSVKFFRIAGLGTFALLLLFVYSVLGAIAPAGNNGAGAPGCSPKIATGHYRKEPVCIP